MFLSFVPVVFFFFFFLRLFLFFLLFNFFLFHWFSVSVSFFFLIVCPLCFFVCSRSNRDEVPYKRNDTMAARVPRDTLYLRVFLSTEVRSCTCAYSCTACAWKSRTLRNRRREREKAAVPCARTRVYPSTSSSSSSSCSRHCRRYTRASASRSFRCYSRFTADSGHVGARPGNFKIALSGNHVPWNCFEFTLHLYESAKE